MESFHAKHGPVSLKSRLPHLLRPCAGEASTETPSGGSSIASIQYEVSIPNDGGD